MKNTSDIEEGALDTGGWSTPETEEGVGSDLKEEDDAAAGEEDHSPEDQGDLEEDEDHTSSSSGESDGNSSRGTYLNIC